MGPTSTSRAKHLAGFTLIELMITLGVFALIMVAISGILWVASHSKEQTAQNVEANQMARTTLDMLARDVRTAGYGADLDFATPQPAIAYVDSTQIILSENQLPYPDASGAPSSPLAYNPIGTPKPKPLIATQWTPPIRYRTGAELIRYTLDLNDDGQVDASDVSTPSGADARATANPNDYVLVREVFGDSTANMATNNGGAQERVALVLKPGGSIPPMYTVYMKGQSAPWDWANGPVPVGQLQNIDRVVLQVTAAGTRPDSRGQYAQATVRTEVNAMRNVPNVGVPEYTVSGYVFDDQNSSNNKDAGEPGLAGATVRFGKTRIAYTNVGGYFQFRAPAGTYTLWHYPPPGYGSLVNPDSVVLTITSSNLTHSFADIALPGGWASITCYNDVNLSGAMDVGEIGLSGIPVTLGSTTVFTNSGGVARLFAPVGSWSALATVPDSMIATSPNPVTGTMVDGDSATASIGMAQAEKGYIAGTVFKDLNKNGTKNNNESGIANVWVGATTDGGMTVLGYAYTDNNGAYTITVPANDPPKTKPYSVFCVPPSNTFPTTATSIGGVWVKANQTVSPYNFGMANYQVITLSASRVLSLVTADLVENDWGKKGSPHEDLDLILGADAGGSDNISVWFNQFDKSPLFNSTPDPTRLAPQSVLSMAVDTLDQNPLSSRPDLVTGTKLSASGNFFVWFTQNTSGNEGYFSSSYDPGQNYRTSDNGDVQAVKTLDVLGGAGPDIIVGTKSSTANQGQVEIWVNDDAATPTFSRAETYSTYGVLSQLIGEVNGIALADLDNDGNKDMVIVTTTGQYSGQLLFFRNLGKLAIGNHFIYMNAVSFTTRAAMAVATTDVNGDGNVDVVVGTQDGLTNGSLYYFRNNGSWSFSLGNRISAPGIVMSLATADMGGGASVNDLIVGWRGNMGNFTGGVAIYYLDVGGIPTGSTDPSGGSIVNMVPAVTTGNFDYGSYPAGADYPYLSDLAAGVKMTSTTGSLVIFIR